MSIHAVIFDFGGVIVRTEDRAPRQQLASRLGMTYEQLSDLVFDSDSARQAALGKISTQEHWDAIRVKLGLSQQEFPAVPREFWGGDSLDRDLVDYIRSLRPQYKTGLLSNAWDDLRDVLENGWKIAAAFDAVVISAEVGVAKPDPKIYHIILERLGVAPAEAVFIDDFSENVAGARAVGMHAIHFKNRDQLRADLDQVLDSPA
jgi:epoxide hydrolase-like predicted phosphatase